MGARNGRPIPSGLIARTAVATVLASSYPALTALLDGLGLGNPYAVAPRSLVQVALAACSIAGLALWARTAREWRARGAGPAARALGAVVLGCLALTALIGHLLPALL